MPHTLSKNSPDQADASSDTALKFISFLVSEPELLERFCALTGMGEADLKRGLAEPVMQGFLLDYALSDESLLLAFAADCGLKPEAIVRARQRLPGFAG